MAKSTMLVVPPKAAARVPVSKSSAEVVPPNGMSRCVCASIPPGITYIPMASITFSTPASEIPARTSLICSPSIRTSARVVSRAVTTVPFRMSVLGMSPLFPGFGRAARVHLLHGDAVLYRAHQPAQIAAHAFGLVHARDARRGSGSVCRLHRVQLGDGSGRDPRPAGRLDRRRRHVTIQVNALVGAVPARDVAQVAADALIAIDLGHD